MWISHTGRFLRAGGLFNALEIELSSTDFRTGNMP